ncbi:MAG TPA: alanine--tRNA ligase-related protein [Streptosporangiaceae bacterium]|nr:alanine--tRNA ligase-related protein [Streptosporangiaceae bacterium]
MNHQEVVQTFTEFFRDRGHQPIPSSSLVPRPGDPVLFTSAGMHPLTPYLEGRPHPAGNRLTGVQRCLRTTDLDEVGDTTHLTVFEMLGSWSLGDYPGTQSVRWGLELVRDGFGIPVSRLHATVYGGPDSGGPEPGVGPDTDLLDTWTGLGVPVELGGPDNWWSNGPTGLCGTDSELFVWTGDGPPQGTPGTDGRWMELWNHVLLRYWRLGDGHLRPLDRPNVDTGMGLERLLTVLQGSGSVFGCDLLQPWASGLAQRWPLPERGLRLVTDHLRSSVVVIGDGVRPSSTGRGYVLRRLIRRALTTLWRADPGATLEDLPSGLVTGTLRHFGPESDDGLVRAVLLGEQQRFGDLLRHGREVLRRRRRTGPLSEEEFRYLHETHGLPREFVTAMAEPGSQPG